MNSQFNKHPAHEVDSLVAVCEAVVRDRIAPGIVVGASSGETSRVVAAGNQTYEHSPKVDSETIFDLASLTKLMATTAVAMTLVEERRLTLRTTVNELLPEMDLRWPVSVGDLLSHTAGFAASLSKIPDSFDPDSVSRSALGSEPSSPPGSATTYSDVGMIVLGIFLERFTGMPLDLLVNNRVSGPLGLDETGFSPGPALVDRIPPTETRADGTSIHGVVHDETARAMGGTAPHAGLFSTINDVLRFASSLLPQTAKVDRFVTPETVAEFTDQDGLRPDRGWVFGLRRIGIDPLFEGLPAGMLGVTGFTGTFLGVDLEGGIAVCILSNSIHPDRENRGMASRRGAIVKAAMAAIANATTDSA